MGKMSRWGIGPIFAFLSIFYGVIMLLLTCYYYPIFQIKSIPYRVLAVFGWIFIVIGIPSYIISLIAVVRAYNAGNLVTTGIFRCCRHPLYASWVVFIVPGIVLLVNSWVCLTIPIFMFVILRILVNREEIYLEEVFGSVYREYKRKVPCILPYGLLK